MTDASLTELALDEAREKMIRAVEHTRGEFSGVRTGRASPAIIEKLRVDYYGSDVPLQQLAGISVPEARVLVVTPYDKGAMKAIEKAIQNSQLGINPSNDGVIIRLVFPQLSEERRKELVKVVRRHAEDGRVALRGIRHGARHELDVLERDGDTSSDEVERSRKELERITHEQISHIDQMASHKEQELLEV